MSKPIEARIELYRKWLNRENERVLTGMLWEPDIPPLQQFLDQVGEVEPVQPEDIHPDIFLPHIEAWHRRESDLVSDVIQPYTPAFGIPWMEAICGCPVIAHPGSLWAAPVYDDLADIPNTITLDDNPWMQKLLEFTREMVLFADGRFPIALPQMRGPLDILAAMRTPEQMCLDLILNENKITQILNLFTDIWIRVAKQVLAEIKPFHGGYLTRMKMWAPGKAITPQNDTSSLISPQMYRQLVSPYDRQIFDAFPYHSFHMHATEYHIIDVLLESEKLTAIQFTLEHTLGGPSLEKVLPVIMRALTHKPVLLVALDFESADYCLKVLPKEGLCVMVAENSPDFSRDFDDWCLAKSG